MSHRTLASLSKAGKGSGGAWSVNSRSICDSRASSTMAGRLNLLLSAASQTSLACAMMVCATLTSR